MNRRLLLTILATASIVLSWGQKFTVKTVEGVEMKFEVISETDKTCRVSSYCISYDIGDVVTIPEKANGYNVIEMDERAFSDCQIVSINISDNIETIGNFAFSNCESLENVKLPVNLKIIGELAFCGCTKLSSIQLPDGIEELGDFSFSGCAFTTIALPNSLKTIHSNAFADCTLLESIAFPEEAILGERILYGCSRLTEVKLPTTMTTLGMDFFSRCSSLAEISLPTSLTCIGANAFYACTSLKEIEIPSGVVSIETSAFSDCSNLKKVKINIPTIGTFFKGMTSLEEVVFGDNVTTIEDNAFEGCTALRSINLTENVTSIGWAFFECESLRQVGVLNIPSVGSLFVSSRELESVKFGNAVRIIETDAFQYNNKLNEIVFAEGLETIERYAFNSCPNIDELILPSTLKTIGSSAFGEFPLVKELILPDKLTNIGSYAFEYFSGLTKIVSKITDLSNISNPFSSETMENALLIIPNGTRAAYINAGWRFSSMFEEEEPIAEKEYTDEQGLKYERKQDYYTGAYEYFVVDHTDALSAEVVIPAKISNVPVTKINDDSFKNCTSLTNITLPNSLTYISSSAFEGCTGVTEIVSLIQDPSKCSASFPDELYENAMLQVPAGTRSAYLEAYPWNKFTIYEKGSNPVYTDGQGVIYTIKKLGEEYYYEVTGHEDLIAKNVTILTEVEGTPVTAIGDEAFKNCTSMKLISIPSQITSIANNAFEGCALTLALNHETVGGWSNSLFVTAVKLGATVESIDEDAFRGCTNLKSVSLPEGLTTIGKSAFNGCSALKSITFPESLETIGGYAFSDCISIKSVTIPKNVNMPNAGGWFDDATHVFDGCNAIGAIRIECANFGCWFQNLPNIKTVSIGSGVSSGLSNNPLSGSTGIESIIVDEDNTIYDSRDNCNAVVETASNTLLQGCNTTTIPESVTAIGGGAFSGMTGVTEITLPAGITSIASSAFEGCTGIQTITSYLEEPISTPAFEDYFTTVTLRVPFLKRIIYKQHSNWNFETIVEMDGPAEDMTIIEFADPVAKQVCVSNWDINEDGEICVGEAKLVTDTKDLFYDISNKAELVSFDEFKYFTNVTNVGFCTFCGCTGLTSVTIPNSVTSIGEGAFSGCISLRSIELPDGLLAIDSYAFRGCSSLKSINLPEGLTSIGESAFYQSGLNTMTIPSTVTSIGDYALAGDIIYCNLTTPIDVGILMSNASETILYVPEGCEEAFRQANGWKDFLIVGTGPEITDWSEGEVTAVVEEPGELRLTLVEMDEEEITRLKIRGKLNSEDIKYLIEGKGKIANLESLDLSDVTFDYDGGEYLYTKKGIDWGIYDIAHYYLTEEENLTITYQYSSMILDLEPSTTVYYNGPNLAGAFQQKGYKHVVMPHGVKRAVYSVFKDCTNLQSVDYPGGIDYVGESAFAGCSLLHAITLAKTDTICNNAFFGCTMLQNVENLSSVKSIGKRAFTNCKFFTGDNGVLRLSKVDSIANGAFSGCKMLNDVRLSRKLYYIGERAFAGCTSLAAITLPNSLKSLSPRAFEDCSTLEDVTYSPELTKLDYTCFYNTPFIDNLPAEGGVKYMGTIALSYDIDSDVAATSPATLTFREGTTNIADNFIESLGSCSSNVTQLNLPSTLVRIGEKAFYRSKVATITLPEGLKEIEPEAFRYSSISKLNLSEGLTAIGEYAFAEIGLASLTYNLKEISGKNIFKDCTSLEKVTIGAKVQMLPEGIFSGCKALTIVKSSERTDGTPMDIGNYAFSDCTNLIKLTLPENVTLIGENAFYGCSSLKSFTTSKSLITIGSRAFYGCSALTSFNTNEGLKSIGSEAFYSCSGLTSVTIGNSVTSIGDRAFNGCSGLTSVTIPNSVTSIGESAFRGCSGLTSVTIGSGIKNIYGIAFAYCPELTDVYCYANNVPETETDAFKNSSVENTTLHVPAESVDAYKDVKPWKNFGTIQGIVETKVKLSKTKAVIEKGKTLTLKAKVYPATEDQSVTWKSSDKTVATVTSAGKVKGVGAGTATITCTSKATGAKATCKVTVGYVKLSDTEVVIEKGEIVTLKSKVYPSTLKDQSVTWESSNPKVVKVASSGKIKGMKAGKATITCTSNATGLKATCEVTVGYVKLSDTKVTIEKGKTMTLKAKVYPTTEDQSVTWKSSDPTIVKVTSTGKIKGLMVGTATIRCISNATGLSATCKVTVVKASAAPSLDGTDEDVTGIEEKPALAEEFDVFDLNGRKVLNKVTSLEGLSNGVYIVNGKKVVIK